MTSRSAPTAKPLAKLRCAIYTRKSSDEGLEQSFNSLDAQREACEAYIMSQVGEGWVSQPTRYDDGGYSGGTMERPGLKQLLADVSSRKIDVVVVYKVDRLTRSLGDFGRIVEIFDAHGVSFVSVTQAFNTTSSMGRLTLNVLLSFAQFEREVTGERIRDKIAASKKKGMWMGGVPPLGYRPFERTLVIDEVEAKTVRHIFSRYLELGSVHALRAELEEQNIRPRPSKRHGQGDEAQFGRGALYHLLSNRLYVGDIVHKDECYPGQHPAIVTREVFEKAGALLQANRQERKDRRVTVARAPLTGRIFDAEGKPLCPVSSRNARGRVYRYYVSAHLQQGGRRADKDTGIRIPAPGIEALVLDRIACAMPAVPDWRAARSSIVRVTVSDDRLTILARITGRIKLAALAPDDHASVSDEDLLRIVTPRQLIPWGGRTEIASSRGRRAATEARIDRSLVGGLARAHALVRSAKASPDRSVAEHAKAASAGSSYIRRLSRLAFLAPDIQQAILEGRQPIALNLQRLMQIDLPLDWKQQRQRLGFEHPL
jgi:DNA invertase Pin-like site-specific DNA recombinase